MSDLAAFRAGLAAHLDWFAERGLKARFWWRDDDAVEPSAPLDRLLALAEAHGVEVALAVIPEPTGPALAERLTRAPTARVLQHGWRHRNHQRKELGEKAAEFGSRRDPAEALAELIQGRDKLQALFGDAFVPALVPPWNRMTAEIGRGAREIGLKGLSSFTWFHPPAPNRLQAHIDMIKWKKGRRFIGWEAAARRFDLQLARRRTNPAEPIGLLSHHLAQNDDCFAFLDEALAVTAHHPGAEWPSVRALFSL